MKTNKGIGYKLSGGIRRVRIEKLTIKLIYINTDK